MARTNKKLHAADAADRASIAEAIRFNVHLRISPSKKHNEEVDTLGEAALAAERLAAIPSAGRKPMVYALFAHNRTPVLVPEDMLASARAGVAEADALIAATEKADAMGAKAFAAGLERGDVPFDLGIAEADAWLAGHQRAKVTAKPAEAPAPKSPRRRAAIEMSETADKTPVTPPAAKKGRVSAKHAEQIAAAERGELPAAPDFSAKTHERYRARLAKVMAMAEAGDIEGLRALLIKPIDSSLIPLDRYRNLCVLALEVRARTAAAA